MEENLSAEDKAREALRKKNEEKFQKLKAEADERKAIEEAK